MARQGSIELDERSRHSVDRQMPTGRYDSIDEVVHPGLTLLEDHRARLEALREALIEGETSGVAGPLDIDALLSKRRAERQGLQDEGHP